MCAFRRRCTRGCMYVNVFVTLLMPLQERVCTLMHPSLSHDSDVAENIQFIYNLVYLDKRLNCKARYKADIKLIFFRIN